MRTPCYIVRSEIDYKYIKIALNEFGYDTATMFDEFNPNFNTIVLNFNGKFGISSNISDKYINAYNRYLIKSLKEFIIEARKLKEPKTNNASTVMKTPCYYINDEKEYNHIKKCLTAFGYDTSYMDRYNKKETLIVLNFQNVFGQAALLMDEASNSTVHERYVTPNIGYFINEAARLKGTTYNKHRNEIMGNSTTYNTKQEPKLGDKVLVKNNGDRNFQTRIYFGKYNGKYTCVSELCENNFHKSKDFMVEFWDEMVPKITITKKDIAEKFNIPLGMFEII